MSISDAKKRANKKYLASQAEIKLRIPPEVKDRWRAAAEARGLSLQKFIIDSVESAIKKGPEV